MIKKIIYISFLLLFIVWLLLSNSIFEIYFSEYVIQKDDLENYKFHDIVLYPGDFSLQYNSSNGVFELTSWAFSPTNEQNDNREAKLLFVSNNHGVYSMELFADVNRADVKAHFDKSYQISSNRLGITGSSSIIGLPDDIYRIYIFVKENENCAGITSTDKFYKKDGKSFEETTFISEEYNKSVDVSNLIATTSSLDLVSRDNMYTIIEGWAIIEGMNSSMQKIILKITDSKGDSTSYTTIDKNRQDVSEYFKSELYFKSGFTAVINTADLPNDVYTLELFIENEDQKFKSVVYELSIFN